MDVALVIAEIVTTNSLWIQRLFAMSGSQIFQFLAMKNLEP